MSLIQAGTMMSESNPTPAEQPEIPKVLDQLKEIKGEATELRNFTITFLSLLLYVNLIIAGTNAEQILRIAPVTLPLLNVPLQLIGFYGFLPWLLLFFHLYLLVQHYLFSQQLFRFDTALRLAKPEEKAYARRNLGNLPFLHWMLGGHHSVMQHLLTFITLVSLVIWPLVTLLWLQMKIMPYHSPDLLACQRTAILLDVMLIAWLWPKTLDRGDCSLDWWRHGLERIADVLGYLPRGLIRLACRFPRRLRKDSPGLSVKPVPQKIEKALSLVSALLVLLLPGLFLATVLQDVVLTGRIWSAGLEEGACGVKGWEMKMLAGSFVLMFAVCWLLARQKSSQAGNGSVAVSQSPGAGNVLILLLGLWVVLFMSLFVTTLPDSCEERLITGNVNHQPVTQEDSGSGLNWFSNLFGSRNAAQPGKQDRPTTEDSRWLKTVDVAFDAFDGGRAKTARMAFAPTAWLHEQHARSGLKQQEYDELLATGAKSCPSQEKAGNIQSAKENEQNLCLMAQPKLPRNLILRDKVLTADAMLKPELEAKLQAEATDPRTEDLNQIRRLELQNRNFDYADFSQSSLPKADLRFASLKHAVLWKARLDGALMNSAHLDQADLSDAHLPGAKLLDAHLPGANLSKAHLPGADLSHAKLPGSNLSDSDLDGANLMGAQLQGADMFSAKLPGADLFLARLPGARLSWAELSGSALDGAELAGTDLSFVQLPSASLVLAELPGAKLDNATLDHAVLTVILSLWPDEKSNEIAEQVRQALALRDDYKNNPTKIKADIAELTRAVKQDKPNFEQAKKPTICLRDRSDEAKGLLPDCQAEAELDADSRSKLAQAWVDLACKDDTEGHWVARRMVERAGNSKIGLYKWFVEPLQKAAEDAETCPGLAELPEEYKKRLQALSANPAQ